MLVATINDLRFEATEGNGGCRGCMFTTEHSQRCNAVCAAAVAAGLPDCDDRGPSGKCYIYVPASTDPRQLPLLEAKA